MVGTDYCWKYVYLISEVIGEEVVCRSQSDYHDFFRRY